MKNIGLVLEGGGMRGLYTAGVLDFFMEKNLYFPYVIGVSAGACNALSYISRQKGRSRDINIHYANDPRYINFRNILRGKSVFNMDFIFNDISNRLIPFDYDRFHHATERLVIPATDCQIGKAVYFEKNTCRDLFTAVRASSSLPFVSKMVEFEGKVLLDGGIADPIPILKSIKDGNPNNVIVLTRHKGYRKKPFYFKRLARLMYFNYRELVHAMNIRYKIYNDTLEYIEKLEKEGKVFVLRPQEPVSIKRIERNTDKLQALYERGYFETAATYEKLWQWLTKCNEAYVS